MENTKTCDTKNCQVAEPRRGDITDGRHDVVARPVVEGDFIQLTGWFDDVWSYVTKAFPVGADETTQLVCHVRRDKYGHAERRGLDTFDVLGTSVCRRRGGLTFGMDTNRLRRVATAAELVAVMEAGGSLIVQLPAFKLRHGRAWLAGEPVGRVLPGSGDVELADGTVVPFASPASLAAPVPLR